MPSATFKESVVFEAIPADRIDRKAGIVKGVRILGAVSKNGRKYTEKAMTDGVSLYENRGINLDHPDRKTPNAERKVTEGFGELRNARFDNAANAVFADHHYPTKHSFTDDYLERCERFPLQIGFSHNAEGEYHMDGGVQIVESLTHVESVDLVGKPATNKGIFESEEKPVKKLMKQALEDAKESKQKIRARLVEAVNDGTIPPDTEVETTGADDADVLAAFRASVHAVVDNEALDADAMTAAIGAIIGQKPVETSTEELATVESLQAEIADLRAGENVRRLLESMKITADEDLVESLKPLNDLQRKALLKRINTPSGGPRPASSPPKGELKESTSNYKARWEKKAAAAQA